MRTSDRNPARADDGSARDSVVTVSSLTKRFGDRVAVDELTFSLRPGTITGFLGPNGAGKTTTLRVLLGLAEPTAGEALVFGRRYRELDNPASRVGAVLESNDFHPGRSGRDHLRALALAADIPSGRLDEGAQRRAVGEAAAIAIGGTIGLEAMFGGTISGASMNPARSLGPALVSGDLHAIWVYILAPIFGAAVGGLAYQFVRGEPPAVGAGQQQ